MTYRKTTTTTTPGYIGAFDERHFRSLAAQTLDWLTVAEAAAFLGFRSKNWIYHLIREGKVKAVHAFDRTLIHKQELLRYRREHPQYQPSQPSQPSQPERQGH